MPKSIVREFDNSNTGIRLVSDFAVVVPGYMGKTETPESVQAAKEAGVYIGDYTTDNNRGVYELTSQAQFTKYIGKFPGKEEPATAPTLEVLASAATGINKYRKDFTMAEIWELGIDQLYDVQELEPGQDHYGENGYLLRSFSVEEQETEDPDARTRTFKYLPVDKDDIEFDGSGVTTTSYWVIKTGNEGADEVAEAHIGNQIAWELLGLGYTVLFKRLNTSENATAQLKDRTFWEPFKDKSTYHFRYLMSGGCYDADVMSAMSEIAQFYRLGEDKIDIEDADSYANGTEGIPNGRGDVIALCDVNEKNVNPATMETLLSTMKTAIDMIPANKYTAIFAPRVAYNMTADKDFGNNVIFPGSFHYLACAATSQQRYAEWYAVAGYARGVSTKSVAYTTLTFGEIAINTLAPRVTNRYATRAVNLILYERGNYYLWGNRTSEILDAKGLKFSHFLNIRQLCTTLKKVLYQASRQFTFDPNSDLLWSQFVNAIRPTLDKMKNNQGVKDFKISRVATDKKALLVAKIRIVPIEALEDFDFSVYLEDSLAGIVISTDETVAE